jgi:hypothetical protein
MASTVVTTSVSVASTTTQPTLTVTTTPTGVTRVGDTSVSPNDGSSISTGALVGIAIAGAALGLLGVGIALWVCLRRRKQKEVVAEKLAAYGSSSEDSLRREMSMSTSVLHSPPPVELDPDSRIVEASDGRPPPELDNMNVRAELQGDMVHRYHEEPPLTPIPDSPIDCLTLESQRTPTPTAPGFPVLPRNHV